MYVCYSPRTQEEGEEGDQEGHLEADHRRTADQAEDQDVADGCADVPAVQVPVGGHRVRRQQHRQDLAGHQVQAPPAEGHLLRERSPPAPLRARLVLSSL